MPHAHPRGTIQFSVDIYSGNAATTLAQHRSLDQLTGKLVSLFDRYRVPANWAVTDPMAGPGVAQIRASQNAQSVVGLVDRKWLGDSGGRVGLLRGLQRTVLPAREQGTEVRSLALRNLSLDHDWDLLVKHDIVAVRDDLRCPDLRAQPASLRFGLWRIPVAVNVDTQSWAGVRGWRLRRKLTSLVRRRAALHFGIDAVDCTQQPHALETIQRLLGFVRQLVDQEEVDVVTMTELADRQTGCREPAPSRSILRAA